MHKLRSNISGDIITPDSPDFDGARTVFYGWFDRRPRAIVRVENENDVARALTYAREQGLPVAVRSGGHSFAGHSIVDGGIVIDLSRMRRIEIDVGSRTAWAQTGLTAAQYTSAAAEYGLATGFGDSGTVGIGGLTLGGGVGFLVRKYGLTIDDLLAAEIVTADGEILRADTETHPDLFWAIRGGGGNFGIATRFKFRLHELDTVIGGILMVPASAESIHAFIEEAFDAPEELSIIANIMKAPPMPMVPAEHHGKLIIMAMMVYAGNGSAGEKAVSPFRSIAPPVADMVRPMKLPEMYAVEGPHPVAVAARSLFVDKFDRQTAESIVEHLEMSKAAMAVAQLRVLGGAMARVPVEATAYAHRNKPIMANVAALYDRPQESALHEEWAAKFSAALSNGDSSVYVNFLGNEGLHRVRDAYPGSTWSRLTRIKARYDPANIFRQNHNIPPPG